MEERRLEWVPLVAPVLRKLMNGQTFVVVTDEDRRWFGDYLIRAINRSTQNRPLLPFVSLGSLCPGMPRSSHKEELEMLGDMLSTTFAGGYTFFYIGQSRDPKYQIASQKSGSFVWALDEHVQNSFYLSSEDEMLDIKLLQLFRLLNRSIDAVLFAEVSLED
jgi:hypothetical protein